MVVYWLPPKPLANSQQGANMANSITLKSAAKRNVNAPRANAGASPRYNLTDETLEGLLARLRAMEEKYGMSTVQFYAQFMAGQMGDSRDFIKWAAFFDHYQELLKVAFQPQPKAA
jgi:hypothetical protein